MKRPSLAALAVATALCAAAPPAQAAEKSIWGPVTLPGGGSAFPTYSDLGVDTFQYAVSFADVAPTRPAAVDNPSDPAYRWPAELDRAIADAAASRINVALLVTNSPGWANGGRSRLQAPDPSAFANFMAAASRRYPSVRRWMIWGEPNRTDRFLPNSENSPEGPRAYARILDAAYGALKAVSARNIVIGGMTWTGGDVKPAPFMKFMRLANGRPPRLDWFGHNPFPFRFPNLRNPTVPGGFRDISDIERFQRQLRRTYGPRARFWLSEFLVLSDRGSDQFLMSVSRAEQARWLRAAYRIADDLGSVAGLGWLSLFDERERPGSSNWGLLTAGGERKPSYGAYRGAPSERFRPSVRA
ncbi:MAG TPA: hypothetical protein VFD31_12480, partial [Thermoleophilaceae bacterium]|nr:hypothetical protein [Thermoleophilaceae bacterium]